MCPEHLPREPERPMPVKTPAMCFRSTASLVICPFFPLGHTWKSFPRWLLLDSMSLPLRPANDKVSLREDRHAEESQSVRFLKSFRFLPRHWPLQGDDFHIHPSSPGAAQTCIHLPDDVPLPLGNKRSLRRNKTA